MNKIVLFQRNLSLTTTSKNENPGLLWDNPVPDLWLSFYSHFFVIFSFIFGCFWRNNLSKACEESTVWVAILCSAAGYILPSPRLGTSKFLQKNASSVLW